MEKMQNGPTRKGPESAPAQVAIPTNFTPAARHESVEHLRLNLQMNSPKWYLQKVLYGYLTKRVSSQELDIIQKSLDSVNGSTEYSANLAKIKRAAESQGVRHADSIGWFSFQTTHPTTRKKIRFTKNDSLSGEYVDVTFKEYFTVPIPSGSPQAVVRNIERFQNVLPELAGDLQKLAEAEDDYIAIKTPETLQMFITHPDSLVVHYRNPAIASKVRSIVEKRLGTIGLDTSRHERVESGFDFASTNDNFDGSHSDLMASVAAARVRELVQDRPEMAGGSESEIREFLDNRAFSEYAKFTPAEMLNRLEKIQ